MFALTTSLGKAGAQGKLLLGTYKDSGACTFTVLDDTLKTPTGVAYNRLTNQMYGAPAW